jgi:phosphatidylserine/phosphatidylglycerophosphate/cardiolipin synthase-like enzyme
MTFGGPPRVLDPGRNCDPLVRAGRFALLVDGSNYYAALAQAIERARQTIVLVGWDLDSRVSLAPGPDGKPLVPPLREFLPAVASRNPDLDIYLSTWEFPIVLATVRDPALAVGRDPFNHPRVHLTFDGAHPPGASHHQKIAVIDDSLAFAGGMDVAGGRWDTPEHRPDDVRRSGKHGPYPPYHDVQALVDGDAAQALGDIVRDRWYRATGMAIPASSQRTDLWPDGLKPDLVDLCVAISRTDVDANGEGRREIEQLHLDLIAAARDCIYIENQYLTSATIVSALCRRLQEADGPEVLIVLPLKNSGWLEENTIEVLRGRSVHRLRQEDRFARLRICYPVVPGRDGGEPVGVHSKVLVIDDRLFRVGSSNLANRSMRLDTECDLTIEATSDSQRLAISALRNGLLAEHLALTPEAVGACLARDRSLVRLVDSRKTASRGLRDLPSDGPSTVTLDGALIDPAGPITTDVVIESLATVPDRPVKRLLRWTVIGGVITAAVIAAWRRVRARRSRPRR